MSFYLLDAIDRIGPGDEASGHVRLPLDGIPMPACLIVEAVGQLAGWIGLVATDFVSRPGAATVQRVRLHEDATAGSTLTLEARVRALRSNAISWEGRALLDGRPLLTLQRCTGPLLPAAELEDPKDLQRRFERLREQSDSSAYPTDIDGIAVTERLRTTDEGGRVLELLLPEAHPLYAAHFPRRPVFPASLLLEAQLRTARDLAGPDFLLLGLDGIKVRSFSVPGDRVELTVSRIDESRDKLTCNLVCDTSDGRRISEARALFERRPGP